MWEKVKTIFAGVAAALAAVLGFLLWTRKKQGEKSQPTPQEVKTTQEISNLQGQQTVTAGQIVENKAKIDALEKRIQQNKGSLDGISKEVAGMTSEQVDAELRKRGLL